MRRREGGIDAGWHLKLPVAGGHPGDREELQLPLEASPAGSPPEEFCTIVSALVRRAPLRPVATLRTERTPFLLRAADDRLIAELVDDVVSVLDGDRVAGRFREIEVEAREAISGELDAIIGVLVASGAELGITSKAAHALGPRATAPPDVPVPATPSPRDPALAAVHAHLLTQARRLLLQDVRMRRDLPDSVHQMRVAARRLRSSLRTFRPLLDRAWADALREELGWVAGELGLMRDTEVLLRRLDEHCDLIHDAGAAEAARAVVDRELGARLISAREASLQALSSTRYHALLDQLVSAVRHPAFTPLAAEPSRKVLPALSWKAWNQLRHEADELSHEVPVQQWHQTRITAKRARYAAEALEPVFGHDASELAKSLEGVTEILGEHQDASVARDTISELADLPGTSGLEGWGLGLLYGVEVEAERDSREQFAAVWARAVRAHKRSSLR
jgi:CHAD domain-containing protein